MQKVILHIQPQLRNSSVAQDFVQVDLMEEELISLTQVIQDVKSIDKVFTDFSQTFNLPASKTNNKLFKYWYNPDIEGFDNQIMANARIELNHFAFKEGKIRLESVTMRNNQPSLYKVTFFGNTVKLNDLIGEDSLTSLDWLANFNHDAGDADVKDGLENGINITVESVSYIDAVIYPLIAHSQQYIYDDQNGSTNLQSGLNISTNTTQDNKRGVLPEDLKPALLIKHIIKAIEEKYSLTFKTGEFFDSSTMNNLYMWMHRDKGNMVTPSNIIVDNNAFTCNSNTTNCNHFSSLQPPIGPQSLNGVYLFNDNQTGGESEGFVFETEVQPTSGNTTKIYTVQIINKVTGAIVSTLENVTGNNSVSIAYGVGSTNPITPTDAFQLATRVLTNESSFTFNVEIDCDHIVWNQSLNSGFGAYETYAANFTSDSSITTNAKIVVLDQMPDIKILDFMNGMFKMFNLTAFVNFNGQIVVKKLDDFFAGGDTIDITEFINTNTHTVNNTIPFKEVDLEYAEPKSILAQTFLNTNNRKYGEIEYKSDFKEGGAYKVTAPFEHMLYSRLNDLTALTNTDIQTGCFLDDDLNPSIGQPLIFYGVYRTGISTGINFLSGTKRPETYGALCTVGTNSTITSYWMPHHANELGSVTTAPSINLNFGSEIDTYNLTDYGGNNNSLFQLNYEDYITDVFSKKARLYKFSAVLPLKILLQLTLDDKIIIGTRLYKINSMTTKLQSGETEFELLNDV